MAQDISLLFGVLGEGALSGDSGKLIQSQLTKIMAELNKNPLKVKVGIDTTSGGKKSWSSQLQQKLDQVSASGKFSAQISTLKLSPVAISDFKKQLTAIVNSVSLSTGTQITISAAGIGEIKSKLKDAQDAIKKTGTDADEASRKIAEFKVQMEALGGQKNAVKKSIDALGKSASTEVEKAQIAEISARYEKWAIEIEKVRAAKKAIPTDQRAAIEAEGAAILTNIDRINAERVTRETSARVAEDTEDRKAGADNKTEASQARKNSALRAGLTLLTQMEKAERDWAAAQTGSSSKNYADIQEDITLLKKLKYQLDNNKISVEEFRKRLIGLQASFSRSSNAIKGTGENMRTLSARMGSLAQKFSAWLSVSQVIMLGVRSVRRMVSATIELDNAMTQLKIVTRDTSQAYEEYLGNITQIATKIGSAVSDLVDSTTTFARLGYSLEESTALAEFTAMLQNVGDIDVSDAQDAITAIIKAFGVSVDEIESIMDKLVITGNNFPISVSQIAEGMNNASSALAAAGNTFEQSVALLTAANTTIQNAAKSSTGLRTIAARLRSTKTELDELGESMTEAEYGDLVAALTKYNVALTDINGEFRSTYDIVADIAAIWDDLSTMEQAALANAIAGVRQQSVFFSMVGQFQEASGAMEDMANSAGTLRESYDVFMESVTAHINQFKAAFQSLGETTFTTDFLNGFIDFGTGLLKVLEYTAKLVNAVGGLNTVLKVTAGILAVGNADAIYKRLKKFVGLFGSIAAVTKQFGEDFALAFNVSRLDGVSRTASAVSGLSFSFKELTASMTTAQLAMGGIVAAIVAISAVIWVIDKIVVTAEEATEAMEESFSEFEEASNKVKSLNDELQTTTDRIRELESQGSLTFVEASELQKLRESVELLWLQADLAEKARSSAAKEAADDTITAYRKNFKNDITSDAVQDYVASSNVTGNNAVLFSDESNISAMLAGIEQMKRLRDEVEESSEDYIHFQGVIDDATKSLWDQASVLGDYKGKLESIPYDELTDSQKTALDEINAAIELIYKALDPSKWNENQWNSIINDGQYADDAKKLEELASKSKVTADTIKSQFPSLVQACKDAGLEIEDVVDHLNASFGRANGENVSTYSSNLSNLADVISELRTSYDLLEGAQSEMDENGGLSAETVEKLAKAEENYLDYLYEENGAVKLNTEAWKENANAKIKSDMRGIQNEIASIEARNAALLESIQLYEDQVALGDPGGEYAEKIAEATREIEKNSEAVLENQKKYDVYASVFQQVSDDGSAAFETLTDKLTEITELYDLVEKAQDEFSQSGVLSASTLSSIAGKFPEMQNAIDLYIAGLKTGKDLLEELSTAYGIDLANWRDAISQKMACSVEFYNSLTSDQKKLIDELGEAYGVDLKNFKTIEQKKVAFQAEIIKALASNYGKYTNASLEGMNAQYDAMMNMGGDNKEIKALGDAIMAIENYNAEIDRIVSGADLISSWEPQRFSNSMDKSGNPGADSKDIEAYIAEIGQYRDAKERLLRTEEKTAKLQRELEHTYRSGSDGSEAQRGQIQLHQELIAAYEEEKNALHDLNEMRDRTISEGADSLRQLGFDVEYDSDANLFYVKNLEHLNELTADSQGEYKSMQEATNALRKDTEGLIDTLSELNEANHEGSESWWESYYAQIEEEIAIYESVLQELENKSNLKKHHIDLAVEAGNVDGIRQYTEEYIRLNREMQQKVHEEADYYRSLGEDENGEHISKLSEDWYGYRDNIAGAVSSAYDAVKRLTENSITLTENWLDNAVEGKDFSGVRKNADALVSYYRSLQEEAHRQAEELRNSGLSDISDQVSGLSDFWWECEESIQSVKQRVVDYLIEIVDASHEAVDEIQTVYGTLKAAADEYAENGGFISVDAFQDIIKLGPQYMQYLQDENGLLVINEERINRVIEAKVRQLAAEQALSYVERIRLALQEDSIENLDTLLYATADATDATFGLAYAELELMHNMGELNDSQYEAALHNIQAIENLANTTAAGIGKVSGEYSETLKKELENMKSGLDDILKYVMDMLKHRIQQQIDALEDLKDAYGDIIDLRKEALDAAKKESEYEDKVADKAKQIAKLQEQINALSLDDSRDAQAQKVKLEEEMAKLQKELADSQSDYAVDAQKEALDDMKEAYENEKDAEIKALEETISSYQKLYDMAIDYIESHWSTLYSELLEEQTTPYTQKCV